MSHKTRIPLRCGWALAALWLSAGCTSESVAPPRQDPPPTTQTISDLSLLSVSATTLSLSWTVPGDMSKAAESYDMRYTDDPSAVWEQWSVVSGLPSPGVAGSTETILVAGLTSNIDLFIRLRVGSGEGVWSALSNEIVGTPHAITGQTYRVTADGSGDAATIQDAVEMAAPGDLVLVAPGHYKWSEQVDLDDPWHVAHGMILLERDYQGVEIRSESGPQATILDGEGLGRLVFAVGYNNQCIIDGFTIMNGVANAGSNYFGGGGIIGHLSPPTIRNCIIRNNSAFGDGTIPGAGGGLWWGGVSSLRVEGCIFENNRSDWGGGIFLVNSFDQAVVTHCVIQNNTATVAGGGVCIINNDASVSSCIIVGNTAGVAGGGLWVGGGIPGSTSDTVTIDQCTIVANSSPSGSGLRVVDLDDCRLRKSIIAFGIAGTAISWNSGGALGVGCSNIFGNPYDPIPSGALDFGNIIHLDPQFCQWPDNQDIDGLLLSSGSPCYNSGCGLMGAMTIGCE